MSSSYAQASEKWSSGSSWKRPDKEPKRGKPRITAFKAVDDCIGKGRSTSSFPSRDGVAVLLREFPNLDTNDLIEAFKRHCSVYQWQAHAKVAGVLESLTKHAENSQASEEKIKCVGNALRNPWLTAWSTGKEVRPQLSQRAISVLEWLGEAPQQPLIHEEVLPSDLISESMGGTECSSPNDTASSAAVTGDTAFDFLSSSDVGTENEVGRESIEGPSAFGFVQSSDESTLMENLDIQSPPPPPVQNSMDVFDTVVVTEQPPVPTVLEVVSNKVEDALQKEEERKPDVSCRIHSAFEDIDFVQEEEQQTSPLYENKDISSSLKPGDGDNNPVQECLIEVELPSGPLGIALDKSIDSMAVLEKFVLLPGGQKGLLALHPSISPGCQIVSINAKDVESMPLAEIGPILATTSQNPRTLVFKKRLVNGVIVNPVNTTIMYKPRVDENEKHRVELQLHNCEQELAKIEELISLEEVKGSKDQLAMLHGRVGKLEREGIDAILLGAIESPVEKQTLKSKRTSLVQRVENVLHQVDQLMQNLRMQPTLPEVDKEELLNLEASKERVVVESPKGSGFSFLDHNAADKGKATTPKASESAFNFM